jgi:hypothetical protein
LAFTTLYPAKAIAAAATSAKGERKDAEREEPIGLLDIENLQS